MTPPDLRRFYPNDLLITGNDLIFFWALRMMLLCTHLTGTPRSGGCSSTA